MAILMKMAGQPDDIGTGTTVVLIDDPPTGDMDVWLRSFVRNDSTGLPVNAAELVSKARPESE